MEVGRAIEDVLLGVPATLPAWAALTLRLPGAVNEPRCEGWTILRGVTGAAWGVPSLVIGRLPFDSAEAGLRGGGMELSALKKLDLRLDLLTAGDEGNCDKLAMVLSERDGRAFLGAGCTATSSFSGEWSVSGPRKSARELAREDALETDRKPSRSHSTSFWLVFAAFVGRGGTRVSEGDGRTVGFLKPAASDDAVRTCPLPGMARFVEIRDALLEAVFVDVAVEGVLERTREERDGFFCSACGAGLALERDDNEVFLRSCSVEAGERSWD